MKYQKFIVSYFYLSLLEVAAISRRTILLVSRTNTDVLVFNFIELTSPSLRLVYTSRMRPSGQQLRGVLSSRTKTASSTTKFLPFLFHFCLSCRDGWYPHTQRRQNTSARYCTCRHPWSSFGSWAQQ